MVVYTRSIYRVAAVLLTGAVLGAGGAAGNTTESALGELAFWWETPWTHESLHT